MVQIVNLQGLEDACHGRREFLEGISCRVLLRDYCPDNGCEGNKDQKEKG